MAFWGIVLSELVEVFGDVSSRGPFKTMQEKRKNDDSLISQVEWAEKWNSRSDLKITHKKKLKRMQVTAWAMWRRKAAETNDRAKSEGVSVPRLDKKQKR